MTGFWVRYVSVGCQKNCWPTAVGKLVEPFVFTPTDKLVKPVEPLTPLATILTLETIKDPVGRSVRFARNTSPELLSLLATHMISENVNLAWVKQCLGHKAIGSTMKYVAVSDSQASAGAQAALMRIF